MQAPSEMRAPFTMDEPEFQAVHKSQYDLKAFRGIKDVLRYRHRQDRSVKLQMALMYECLGEKQSMDFEALEKAKETRRLSKTRTLKGVVSMGTQRMNNDASGDSRDVEPVSALSKQLSRGRTPDRAASFKTKRRADSKEDVHESGRSHENNYEPNR